MSLNDISIQDLVKQQTIKTIQSANFAVLKKALVDRNPLPAVVNAIDSVLADEIKKDKEQYKVSATQSACQEQIKHDVAEENNDAQQDKNDSRLTQEFISAQFRLNIEVTTLAGVLLSHTQQFNSANAQLISLNSSLNEIQRKLNTISSTRDSIYRRYPVVRSGHVHHHSDTNTHHHGHPGQQPPQVVYSPMDSNELSRLSTLESQLISERLSYTTQLKTQEAIVAAQKSAVTDVQKQHSKKQAELDGVIQELSTHIPNRKTARSQRAIDRVARNNARLDKDPDLMQLSAENGRKLQSNINNFNLRLASDRDVLMKTVNSSSYNVFREQLLLQLDEPSNLSLSSLEIEALQKIAAQLKKYVEMEKQADGLQGVAGSLQSMLRQKRQELQTAQDNYGRFQQNNPQLLIQNEQLQSQNNTLKGNAAINRTTANRLFIGVGSTGGAALISGLVVLLMLLNPLFFIAPGVFALAAAGTLIAALVFKYKENANLHQIQANGRQIATNSQQVNKQTAEMTTLNAQIPALREEISHSANGLEQANKELRDHRARMSNFMRSITEVEAVPARVSQVGVFSDSIVPIPVTGANNPDESHSLPTTSTM